MKRSLACLAGLSALSLLSAAAKPHAVVVTNPLDELRVSEMIEARNVPAGNWLVHTAEGELLPCQRTHEGTLIFPATIPAKATVHFTLTPTRQPMTYATITCGRIYPERVDDMAWENDRVAFRTYGPALQKSGERAYGYDVWCKRATTQPVVEKRYYDELKRGITYHKDNGNGLDCYKVGKTLGAGTTALLSGDGSLYYPWAYKTCEILDNGPLRITFRLTYPERVINGSHVTETRTISLDAYTHFNKTTVSYAGLPEGLTPVVGIVQHDRGDTFVSVDRLAYADPTDPPKKENGTIFVGALFPIPVTEAKERPRVPTEQKNANDLFGHLIGVLPAQTGSSPFTYYWGAAWSKGDIPNFSAWETCQQTALRRLRNPLEVHYVPGK